MLRSALYQSDPENEVQRQKEIRSDQGKLEI